MAKPLDGFWIGAGYQRDRATIRSLGFSVPTFCFSREERDARNGVTNWLCLHKEASLNIPIDGWSWGPYHPY